jgi:pyruvyltransferase
VDAWRLSSTESDTEEANVPTVVNWNPHQTIQLWPARRRVPVPFVRVRNFGDLLGPWIVERIASARRLGASADPSQRLLTVGSIGEKAIGGDVLWGSGLIRDPAETGRVLPADLDVRATRGPLTAACLRSSGIPAPEVFGDPALLVPRLWRDGELGIVRRSGGTVMLPHYRSDAVWPKPHLSARGSHLTRIRAIASAELVISSSLHGIILAEAYGVPVIPVREPGEPEFKYRDYFEGTGRELPPLLPSLADALRADPIDPLEGWDPQPLLDAFPSDLWISGRLR